MESIARLIRKSDRYEYYEEKATVWTRAKPEGPPPPMCRVCQREVQWYEWEWYAPPPGRARGFYGFEVRCHGETMSGTVPEATPLNMYLLEVFCWTEPRSDWAPIWWIDCDGAPLFIAQPRVGPDFIGGPIGRFGRKWLMPVMGAVGLLNLSGSLFLLMRFLSGH